MFLLFTINRDNRHRRSAMDRVELGDPAERVNEVIGVGPTRCPAGPLDHLQESFSEGWPPASIDVALEELEAQTSERWVYPVEGATAECGGVTTRTEVGVAPDGTVLWIMPVLGRSVLRLPTTVTPAGIDTAAAAS